MGDESAHDLTAHSNSSEQWLSHRNMQVMDLLTESFEAHTHGSDETAKSAIERAVAIDAQALVVLQGGMVIGEVPNPERDWPGWGGVRRREP